MSEDSPAELWDRLDEMHRANSSLRLALDLAEQKIEERENEIVRLRESIGALTTDMAELGRELNLARQAAADSVREYIAASGR